MERMFSEKEVIAKLVKEYQSIRLFITDELELKYKLDELHEIAIRVFRIKSTDFTEAIREAENQEY